MFAVASLTSLFKHIGSSEEPCTDEIIREKVLCFVRDKVRQLTIFSSTIGGLRVIVFAVLLGWSPS